MDGHKGKPIFKTLFRRRDLRLSLGSRTAFGREGLGVRKSGSRFSFPVVVFVSALIISPLIFLSAVAGERAVSYIARSIHAFKTKADAVNALPADIQCGYRHPLDNTCLGAPWENKKIVAVSIDNHAEARPASGLAAARLVIEAPVEGGITRFLAFFAEGDAAPEIGPVRSARPYFIDWAEEYQATLVHVGGSPEALERLKKEAIKSIDGMTGGAALSRRADLIAPHSTYSSSEKLFAEAKRISKVQPLLLKGDEESRNLNGKFVRIPAASSSYEVSWKYDEEKKTYKRSGTDLTAKNVLVLRMPVEIIDEIGRRRIGTLGTGDALMFLDGELVIGKWKRDTLAGRTIFLASDGRQIALPAGNIWIEIVSLGAVVEYN